MSAPPGFNPNDSLLPDPGANSAPIHIMKGGGLIFQNGGWTPQEEETLEKYQLGPGGLLESEISSDDKIAFLQQIKSFDLASLNVSTLKKDQWAILKVINALLAKQRSLLRRNMPAPSASAPASAPAPASSPTVPPPNTAGLPAPGATPSGQAIQTGGFDVQSLFDVSSSTETEAEPEPNSESVISNVAILNSKAYAKTRKRQAGGKPKLRPFAKAKTKGKRK